MSSAGPKRAYEFYRSYFTRFYLQLTFDEKVSNSRAVGTDGIRPDAFAGKINDEISLILRKVEDCTYNFTSYRQKLISKGAYRLPRALSIPTLRDRLTLRVMNDILNKVFLEARLWRPHVYIKSIKEALGGNVEGFAFVRIDIEEFYPSIDHEIMMRKVRQKIRKQQIIHLIHSAICNAKSRDEEKYKGIPQGLSISNILASIYLSDVDRKFKARFIYFRYVDDILVICDREIANLVFQEITNELSSIGLSTHSLGQSGKSQISDVPKGIDYLGFHLTPTKVSVRKSSYARMFENILAVMTEYRHVPAQKRNELTFIWRLNLKITGCIYNGTRYGWLFFFSQIDDLQQLGPLDSFVTEQLKKRGLKHLRPKVKKFIRSYHEVRKNLQNTNYIPRYDDYNIDDIVRELAMAEGTREEELRANYSEEDLRRKFAATVKRQTRDLEKDLIEAFS